MRNQIITYILLAIFILGIISLCSFGVEVGKLKVSSIDGILQKNEELNEKIEIAKQLTSDEYSGTIRRLEQTYEKHQITKEKYEEMLDLTNEKKNNIYEIKQYDIGYLWKVIGTYAANHKLNVSMSVEKTTGQDLYNFNFNATGTYINIRKFITKIENNSDLNFRIYNFKMVGSGEGKNVNATFVVKDINIDPDTTIEKNTNATIDSIATEENDVEGS